MWRDYSKSYMKNNRASSLSIMVSALVSSLFLSFLCTFFYNIWMYGIEHIITEGGDWQGRIEGELGEAELLTIRNFANVEKVVVNEELSKEKKKTVDVYFQNVRRIFNDMPLITQQLGLEEDAASYHLVLLSRYLIHDPKDENPPLLLTLYLFVLLIVSFSLILVIRNSFAVSMNERVRQFGILSSVGAAPAQILGCLMQEAAALCAVPVLFGILTGTGLSCLVIRGMNIIAENAAGRHDAIWTYHPMVLLVTLLSVVFTVLFSAWLPAVKLSRLTPLEAVRGEGVLQMKRKRRSPILFLLFGIEGELAGNALKAQKKSLRTATLSLTLSFMGFTMMLGFFALSELSTKYTYFERYQNAWDVMVTVKDTGIEDFELLGEVQGIEGIRDVIAYQKVSASGIIPQDNISTELATIGGPRAVAGDAVWEEDGFFRVKAPLVIMDDAGFARYCEQVGTQARLDGTVVLNRIWDSLNSNFRYKKEIPFVKDSDVENTIVLQNEMMEGRKIEVPVIAYTNEPPALREEYENYSLVQFIPLSLWERIGSEITEQVGSGDTDMYIRILGCPGAALAEMNTLEKSVSQIIGSDYQIESENRIQEKITNDKMIGGYKLLLGGLCIMLALIGIANVFSYTLGFLGQRKREFAQYMSVGLTPLGMKKMFFVEVLVIAGRPILITLPLTAAFMAFTLKASYVNPGEFLPVAPVAPMLAFGLAIFGFVGIAYYLGGKRVYKSDLSEAMRN